MGAPPPAPLLLRRKERGREREREKPTEALRRGRLLFTVPAVDCGCVWLCVWLFCFFFLLLLLPLRCWRLLPFVFLTAAEIVFYYVGCLV